MNDAHFNQINKCVDQSNSYHIKSSWIDDTEEHKIQLEVNKDTISDDILLAPQINRIQLRLVIQSDSGANCNLTNNIALLTDVHDIPLTMLATCNSQDTSNISTTQAGYLLLRDDTGAIVRTKVYYAVESDGTVLSPTAITKQNKNKFNGWINYADNDTKSGKLVLTGRKGQPNLTFRTTGTNDLWFHDPNEFILPNNVVNNLNSTSSALDKNRLTINRLSDAASYELWHQRLGHCGQTALQCIHKHAKGVPKLRGNAFYKCPSCMTRKLCIKQTIGQTIRKNTKQQHLETDDHNNTFEELQDDIFVPNALPGQHFHMDFGFVRGSQFKEIKEGKTITSIDGFNSYLIIIDRSTRYTWIFLQFSKDPPINVIERLLSKFKTTHPHRTVRTDQGGELGGCKAFKQLLAKKELGFSLELTGADASAQNGRCENPNRVYGQMMRCMLHSADIGPAYWSFALIYAVYIKNRLPHATIKMSPFEAFTGLQPNLDRIKVFGCRTSVKKPGKRDAKLDNHSYTGRFLGFTATPKNINYIDDKSGQLKSGTHSIFDEAHMTTPASKAPLAAQALQRLGYHMNESWIMDENRKLIDNQAQPLLVQKLSPQAKIPTKGSKGAIGYDLFSNNLPITIQPNELQLISTGIAFKCPTGTYGRIAPRSGLTIKSHLNVLAGVIDPDYTGEIIVVIFNFGKKAQTIDTGQRIAQVIFESASNPTVEVVDKLPSTDRSTNGFGSTDDQLHSSSTKTLQPISPSDESPTTIPFEDDELINPTINSLKNDLNVSIEMPYNISLSLNPFDNYTHRTIQVKGDHPLLGLSLQSCTTRNIPQIVECLKSTPAIRIPRWKTELKNAYVVAVDNNAVNTIDQVKNQINIAREKGYKHVDIQLATFEKISMHPQLGVPQLYHDQLNIIGQHLWDIKNSPEWQDTVNDAIIHPHIITLKSLKKITILDKAWINISSIHAPYKIAALKKRKRLTRRILQLQADWNDWKESEFKQLDQYRDQNMFGKPTKLPIGANLLHLLWTYLVKDDSTKKARCVCNGSSRMTGSVTLAETYAGSLDQSASKVFWAATAINNSVVIGADAANAFAEAGAPKAPLFVTIDKPYREWYKSRFPNEPEIPDKAVLSVHGALQGHPESPRLWSKLIDAIIKELNLKPCHHEPCLYHTNNAFGEQKEVLFLRQVDDFAISCQDQATAERIIKAIDDKMTIKIKNLGLLSRFNGIDIRQTKHYIQLYNKTYINKISSHHKWLHEEVKQMHEFPLPMNAENDYKRKLETSEPLTEKELKQYEKEMGFGYRQAIGELIYAMVTCRPDIAFPVIKLAQYSTKPSTIHFEAVKDIFRFLNATKDEGIYFWRKTPRDDLPLGPVPQLRKDNNYDEKSILERRQVSCNTLFGMKDSDWAGDSNHRKSVTGIVIKLAGGTVLYKARFQETIALSTTEAEFIAAVEAGKYILYLRSILHDIGMAQDEATILYEDNQGSLLMAQAQQPTKRTRHIDIKHFVLQDWCEQDLILIKRINTTDNSSDILTKATARTTFYRHTEYIQGKVIPEYVKHSIDY